MTLRSPQALQKYAELFVPSLNGCRLLFIIIIVVVVLFFSSSGSSLAVGLSISLKLMWLIVPFLFPAPNLLLLIWHEFGNHMSKLTVVVVMIIIVGDVCNWQQRALCESMLGSLWLKWQETNFKLMWTPNSAALKPFKFTSYSYFSSL